MNFDAMLSEIRQAESDRFNARYHPDLRTSFDVERKARIVARVLDYLGAHVPEAREIVGEVSDLVQRLRTAEEVAPMVRHFY